MVQRGGAEGPADEDHQKNSDESAVFRCFFVLKWFVSALFPAQGNVLRSFFFTVFY
jgi:hypothetical protein